MSAALVVLSASLASAVEMIEALTIVLALGVTRGWRSPLLGTAAALAVLAGLTAAIGPAFGRAPLDLLRLVVGSLLLVFGLQWLRKAILRASGQRELHDEELSYRAEVALAASAGRPGGRLDGYAFVVALKSVLLEGLEVAFIVVTLGATGKSTGLAAAGAGIAFVLVATAGVVARRPLARVPENALKFAVGVMLTAFGVFWAAEGAGVEWPGHEGALVALVAFTAGWALTLVYAVRIASARGTRPA